MPTMNLTTGTVAWQEAGTGLPLVLLHANPGDSQDFEAVTDDLARRYRVIGLDWPGYGRSDVPRTSSDVNVLFLYEVLCEFLDRLDLPPALFVGNSVGGNAAARLAAHAPERVRGLVLVSPGGFTPHNFVSRAFCRLQAGRWSLSPARFARLYLKVRSPTARAMLQRARDLQAEPQRVAFNRAIWASFGSPENDLRPLAAAIRTSTMLMFGSRDPVIPAEKDGRVASGCLPHAEMRVMPCGHAPFAEIPEQFLAEVLPFLDHCAASSAPA